MNKEENKEYFAWIQFLYLSFERYRKLSQTKYFIENPTAKRLISAAVDGDCCAYYIGKENDVRKLAREYAKKYSIKRWKLIPAKRHSFLYTGEKAYREDNMLVFRPPDINI